MGLDTRRVRHYYAYSALVFVQLEANCEQRGRPANQQLAIIRMLVPALPSQQGPASVLAPFGHGCSDGARGARRFGCFCDYSGLVLPVCGGDHWTDLQSVRHLVSAAEAPKETVIN